MIVIYPKWTHPVFVEWRKWYYKSKNCNDPKQNITLIHEAKKSIEAIAEFLYPDSCVVGHMIMECDFDEMEREEKEEAKIKALESGYPHTGDE